MPNSFVPSGRKRKDILPPATSFAEFFAFMKDSPDWTGENSCSCSSCDSSFAAGIADSVQKVPASRSIQKKKGVFWSFEFCAVCFIASAIRRVS